MILSLFYPIIKAGRNRFIKSTKVSEILFRDGIVVILALLIMGGGYFGTRWMLNQLQDVFNIAYLSPTVPLNLLFLVLFGLLVISNIVSFSGSFFLSEDLELLLASPLSKSKLFFQRFFATTIATSLVSFIFIMPVILAYGIRYNPTFSFFASVMVMLVPYFIIPATLGFIIATILAFAAPLRRSKIFFLLFILLFLAGVSYAVDVGVLLVQSKDHPQDLSQLVKIFTATSIPWAPSTWLVESIGIFLRLGTVSIVPRALLMAGSAFGLLGFSAWLFDFFHAEALSQSRSHQQSKRYQTRLPRRIIALLSNDSRVTATYIYRDAMLLLRDVSQLFQMLLLGGILAIYLYNLRIFAGLSLAGPTETWWRNFLFISNFCMSSFIALALCTRFVFPSISTEGRSYFPYLVKAPINFKRYLSIKFRFWFSVVAVIHVSAIALGVIASGGGAKIVLLNAVGSLSLCYGIVGIAIGYGGKYSRFDWEHLSQLAVGYGNIIFMLSGAFWILLHVFPIWAIVSIPGSVWNTSRILILIAVILVNVLVKRFALMAGERGLFRHSD